MFRRLIVSLSLVTACGLVVGCGGSSTTNTKPSGDKSLADKAADAAKDAGKKAEAAGKDAVEKGKEAVEKGKEAVAKARDELVKSLGLPETKVIEEKINGLTGDAKTEATNVYEQIKKYLTEFAKSDTVEGWKEKFEPLVKKLKDMLKL